MKYNTPTSQLFLIKKWLAMSLCAPVPAMQATSLYKVEAMQASGLYKVEVLQDSGLYNNFPILFAFSKGIHYLCHRLASANHIL